MSELSNRKFLFLQKNHNGITSEKQAYLVREAFATRASHLTYFLVAPAGYLALQRYVSNDVRHNMLWKRDLRRSEQRLCSLMHYVYFRASTRKGGVSNLPIKMPINETPSQFPVYVSRTYKKHHSAGLKSPIAGSLVESDISAPLSPVLGGEGLGVKGAAPEVAESNHPSPPAPLP